MSQLCNEKARLIRSTVTTLLMGSALALVVAVSGVAHATGGVSPPPPGHHFCDDLRHDGQLAWNTFAKATRCRRARKLVRRVLTHNPSRQVGSWSCRWTVHTRMNGVRLLHVHWVCTDGRHRIQFIVQSAASTAAFATSKNCRGTVRLRYGDSASHIVVKNIGCKRAKRAIKTPARKLGYTCSNPFDRPRGSGGFIHCRKNSVRIRFLYTQS